MRHALNTSVTPVIVPNGRSVGPPHTHASTSKHAIIIEGEREGQTTFVTTPSRASTERSVRLETAAAGVLLPAAASGSVVAAATPSAVVCTGSEGEQGEVGF